MSGQSDILPLWKVRRPVAPLYREYVHLRWTWTGRRNFDVGLLAWNFPLLRFSENGWRGLEAGGLRHSESRRKPPPYIQGNQAPSQRLFHKLLSSFSWKTPKGHPLRILRRGFFFMIVPTRKKWASTGLKKENFQGTWGVIGRYFSNGIFFSSFPTPRDKWAYSIFGIKIPYLIQKYGVRKFISRFNYFYIMVTDVDISLQMK